jgi:hypothetical protein
MLNIFADVHAAATVSRNTVSPNTVSSTTARPASGAGTLLPSCVEAWPAGTAAVVFARPRVRRAAEAFRRRSLAVGHGAPSGQQGTAKQYLNMTRIAVVASGGGLGPHPARDPV